MQATNFVARRRSLSERLDFKTTGATMPSSSHRLFIRIPACQYSPGRPMLCCCIPGGTPLGTTEQSRPSRLWQAQLQTAVQQAEMSCKSLLQRLHCLLASTTVLQHHTGPNIMAYCWPSSGPPVACRFREALSALARLTVCHQARAC